MLWKALSKVPRVWFVSDTCSRFFNFWCIVHLESTDLLFYSLSPTQSQTGANVTVGSQSSFIEFAENGSLNAMYMNQKVEVRRLSTKSKVKPVTIQEQGLEYFTEWAWYWKENTGKWTKYDVEVKIN